MSDSDICVSKAILVDAKEELEKYVEYIDKLPNSAAHGFAHGDMDRIDFIISQLETALEGNKSCN